MKKNATFESIQPYESMSESNISESYLRIARNKVLLFSRMFVFMLVGL